MKELYLILLGVVLLIGLLNGVAIAFAKSGLGMAGRHEIKRRGDNNES